MLGVVCVSFCTMGLWAKAAPALRSKLAVARLMTSFFTMYSFGWVGSLEKELSPPSLVPRNFLNRCSAVCAVMLPAGPMQYICGVLLGRAVTDGRKRLNNTSSFHLSGPPSFISDPRINARTFSLPWALAPNPTLSALVQKPYIARLIFVTYCPPL